MAEKDEPRAERLSTHDAALLSEQIAGLTRAGVPLASGLQALSAELPRGRLRRMTGALSRSLTQGASLDEAIAAQGRALPAHLRGLVLAGQRTGRTPEVLGRFAGYAQIGADVRRQLGLSLVYPIVSIILAVALLLFVLLFIVSGFERIFEDFGIALPLVSQVLITISSRLRASGLILAEVLAGFGRNRPAGADGDWSRRAAERFQPAATPGTSLEVDLARGVLSPPGPAPGERDPARRGGADGRRGGRGRRRPSGRP